MPRCAEWTRACLKIAFGKLCIPLCGRFTPNEGGVAGYVDRIWGKYSAKWDVQIAGMNFQTRSRGPAASYIPNTAQQFSFRFRRGDCCAVFCPSFSYQISTFFIKYPKSPGSAGFFSPSNASNPNISATIFSRS